MQERWSTLKSDYLTNEKIDLFLKEVIDVCKKHNFSISHEDGHGAFVIEIYEDDYAEWLNAASIGMITE